MGGDFLSCFTTEMLAIICLFMCGLSCVKNISNSSTEQKHQRQRQNKTVNVSYTTWVKTWLSKKFLIYQNALTAETHVPAV